LFAGSGHGENVERILNASHDLVLQLGWKSKEWKGLLGTPVEWVKGTGEIMRTGSEKCRKEEEEEKKN
jgi:hypothetical protein